MVEERKELCVIIKTEEGESKKKKRRPRRPRRPRPEGKS